MERKYYLRGLGLGIAVTAIIMSVALPDSRPMTNDEIITRAKELGMVENTVLSNTGNTDDSQESEVGDRADLQENEVDDHADAQDAADQSQGSAAAAGSVIDIDSGPEDAVAKEERDTEDEAEGETVPEANNAGQENAADEENHESDTSVGEGVQDNTTSSAEDDNETFPPGTVKVITINNGDSSYTVAKKLADVGVVTSAQNFDTFLCQNGYDKRLRTGNFSIPADASDEQIARIVTGME